MTARCGPRFRLAAGHLNVKAADADANFFGEAAGPINQATTLFSAISALVGFMFAYCAMLLTVPLRRGLVRDLRRDGATRWMTIKTLLFDAAVLGGVASLLGLALGDVLSAYSVSHQTPAICLLPSRWARSASSTGRASRWRSGPECWRRALAC